MKKIFRKGLSINTIILFIISLISLVAITSSQADYTALKNVKISEVQIEDKETALPEPHEETITQSVETKEEQKKTTTKKTTAKKTTSTKKTTTKKTTAKKTTTTKTTTTKTTTTKTLEQKLQEKTKKYGIEIGNISISNSTFSKDLVKDDGSYYYLDRNLDGKLDHKGTPFIDFRNDFTGRKTIIYAHSSKSGNGPFNYLQNYNGNKAFYQKHKYITVVYGGKTYKYLIFSAYISLADSEESEGLEYFHKMYYTDAEWEKRINEYKNKSDYDTGVSVSKNDKILILQTCSMDKRYNGKYYRYNQLVMGKLVSVK